MFLYKARVKKTLKSKYNLHNTVVWQKKKKKQLNLGDWTLSGLRLRTSNIDKFYNN